MQKLQVQGRNVTVLENEFFFCLEKQRILQLLSDFARHGFPRLPLDEASENSRNAPALSRRAMNFFSSVIYSLCISRFLYYVVQSLADRPCKFAVILSTFVFTYTVKLTK